MKKPLVPSGIVREVPSRSCTDTDTAPATATRPARTTVSAVPEGVPATIGFSAVALLTHVPPSGSRPKFLHGVLTAMQ